MTERELRSFGRRKGRRLNPTKQAYLDGTLAKAGIELPEQGELEVPTPVHLEIGFGQGEHLAAQALANPDITYIGCELFINGVANLCTTIEEHAIDNIRIWPDDARQLITRLPSCSVAHCEVLFPDPWPKTKHKKRRLVNRDLLDVLMRLQPVGATLLLASDNTDYVARMLELLLTHPAYMWDASEKADWQRPPKGWVPTKYQIKDNKHGSDAVFLLAKRVAVQ